MEERERAFLVAMLLAFYEHRATHLLAQGFVTFDTNNKNNNKKEEKIMIDTSTKKSDI